MKTLDEILTVYEEQWRANAMADRRQARSTAEVSEAECAWLPVPGAFVAQGDAAHHAMDWRCPYDGRHSSDLAAVFMHLNDGHGWTWDQFANKTRDVLQQGGVACVSRDTHRGGRRDQVKDFAAALALFFALAAWAIALLLVTA
jgi:hypothetical protein